MANPLAPRLLPILLLAACSMAPTYHRPVAPIADRFPATTAGDAEAPGLAWPAYFTDPALKARIAAALVHNRDLAQSVARIAEARARFRITDSQRLPEVGASAGAQRSQIALGAAGLGPALGGGTARFNQFNAGLAITSFEIDFWGRVRNQSAVARAEYLATVEGHRAFVLSLIGEVAQCWFGLRAAEARLALIDRSLANRKEGERIARVRLAAGLTSTIDHDQALTLLTEARAERASVERELAAARQLLDVLTGGPPAGEAPPALPLDTPQTLVLDPGLPSALLVNRPDVLAAEQRLRAANANIGAARAAFLPTISLTATLGFAAPGLNNLFSGDSGTWHVGGDALLPIFDGGRRRAELGVARAQADGLIAAYQRAVQTAFREVADALNARRTLADQLAAQTETIAAQQRLVAVARRRYANGISPYLEVLDAERNLFTAEQQLLIIRAQMLQNDAATYVALGGGSAVGINQRLPVPREDRPPSD